MSDIRKPAAPRNASRPPGPDSDVAEERMDDGTELGGIRIHHGVIGVIARIATLKVPGVLELAGSFTDGLANMIGKSAVERGVKVEVDGQNVRLELQIVIEYGVRIPQVAWRIQNDVCRAIEEMTGKKVAGVDVVVQGVKMPPVAKKEGAPG